MNKLWLRYLLLFCITMQSFFVVANNQELHQPDTQHLKTEHSHKNHTIDPNQPSELTKSLALSETGDAEHNENDCHHCGHCHGSHMQWVYLSHHFTDPTFTSALPFHYIELARNHIVEHDLRPPIT